jgi:hypothetical protein
LLAVGGCIVQPLQGPWACIIKDIAGCLTQAVIVPFGESGFIPLEGYFFQHGFFGGFQKGIQAPKHYHGQYDITVFSTDVDIAQAVVSDRPNEGYEFVVNGVVH